MTDVNALGCGVTQRQHWSRAVAGWFNAGAYLKTYI